MLARCSFFCVGVDAHIDPLGTIEFALDFRKNGFTAGTMRSIVPYEPPGRLPGGFLFASGEKIFSIRATNAQSCRLLRQRDK